MLGFFKVFLRGIVCTILLPFILLVWVLYGVYCLIVFLIMFVKSVILFFAGGSASGEMKEDIEARKMILENEQAQAQAQQAMNIMFQNAMAQVQGQQPLQQQSYTNPINSSGQSEQTFEQPNNEEGGNNNGQSY